jgi:subtilisin family serine protease
MRPRRLAVLVVVALALTACAGRESRAPRYHWSYVHTKVDPFWWADLIRRTEAHQAAGKGAGATVAIVGTGILPGHEDLLTVQPGEATCGAPGNTTDVNGHGTQLAGIVAGRDNGYATRGVAPDAVLVPIKVDCGLITSETLTRGIDAAIGRKPDIILLAIGGYPAGMPDVEPFLAERIARNPGILFVVASAWDGKQYPFPGWTKPANAIVVAAMTRDADPRDRARVDVKREIPYTTRRGDIWAPGWTVGTADIQPKHPPKVDPKYEQFLMNGTSPAAAVVAGCAALIKSKTGVTGTGLKTALLAATEPKETLGPSPNGRLDCAKAFGR